MEFKDFCNKNVGTNENAKKLWHDISNLVMKNDISDKKDFIIYNLKRNQKLTLKTTNDIHENAQN